eukprot:9434664-Pyramimonas_sp.AAC.1
MESIEAGQVQEYCVTVVENANAAELRATIAWHDPPAALNSEQQLVNDLDLTLRSDVVDPRLLGVGSTVYGNMGGEADRVNNAERVRVRAAKPGLYVVTVTAFRVVQAQ